MSPSAKAKNGNIKDRIAASIAKSRPKLSMNPPGVGGELDPDAADKVTPPDVAEFIGDTEELHTIRKLVALHAELTNKIKPLSDALKAADERLKPILGQYGTKLSMTCDGQRVNYYESTRKSLSKDKLIAAGVSPVVITQCTTESLVRTLRIGEESCDER